MLKKWAFGEDQAWMDGGQKQPVQNQRVGNRGSLPKAWKEEMLD